MDIEALKKELKNKKTVSKKVEYHSFSKMINHMFIVIIITLMTLIVLKSNSKLKTSFYKNVFDKNINFAKINRMFKDKFGSPIPFTDSIKKQETKEVFNEKLEYKDKSKYLDGVKLTVEKNYLVPNIKEGIVVFIGDKEKYGYTVIVQGIDGVDIWYSNIKSTSLKPYDYIKQGNLIGETSDTNLYLVYKRDGKVLNYEDYL